MKAAASAAVALMAPRQATFGLIRTATPLAAHPIPRHPQLPVENAGKVPEVGTHLKLELSTRYPGRIGKLRVLKSHYQV